MTSLHKTHKIRSLLEEQRKENGGGVGLGLGQGGGPDGVEGRCGVGGQGWFRVQGWDGMGR